MCVSSICFDDPAFAGVTLGMHFPDDFIVGQIIDIHETMFVMRADAGEKLRKDIRVVSDDDLFNGVEVCFLF